MRRRNKNISVSNMQMELFEKLSKNGSLSDADKFIILSMIKSNHNVVRSLSNHDMRLNQLLKREKYSFSKDVGANVLGSAIWDGFILLGSKIFKL